ncbi:zinc finger protein 35 isoform X1 [Oryzias latipes]|uniref:C2H2-type domain-containing protein n=1 Tax=Oryzias latipes TaxID=8090 RepID=A0A3B3HHM5_ORYLA|nr:zinc finger protein 35 isoform X1 [Oryzias latipes]
MAETIVTFQSQLSGVMETVFKAAMFEITRLVEDSFLEEVTRCREQVESLRKRLRWAESRSREKQDDTRDTCAKCGRAGPNKPAAAEFSSPEKNLKQESVIPEEEAGSLENSAQVHNQDMEEAHCTGNAMHPLNAQDDHFGGQFKEEPLQTMTEINEVQEWDMRSQEADPSSLQGSSKRFSEPKIAKWETGFEQGAEPSQEGHSAYSSEALFQSRYGMDQLGGVEEAANENTSMMGMASFSHMQGSSSHLGGDLADLNQCTDKNAMEMAERADHHCYQTVIPQKRRLAPSPPAASPEKANLNEKEAFTCLLIDEEGYLQDTNVPHASSDAGILLGFRGQGIPFNQSSSQGLYESSNACSGTLNLSDTLQHQTASKGGRRDASNSCSASFPNSVSLKTHKRTQKSTKQGVPFSRNQSTKSFSQACNLQAHQKTHSAQELHLCSHCGRGFSSFEDLRSHKCGQIGDKPYCCTVCGNKFSRLWNLKLHQRIHTQEKPHRCNMCDKSFTRADILKIHQRTHTGERPYCCSVCNLSFKRLDHLKSHQRKHINL